MSLDRCCRVFQTLLICSPNVSCGGAVVFIPIALVYYVSLLCVVLWSVAIVWWCVGVIAWSFGVVMQSIGAVQRSDCAFVWSVGVELWCWCSCVGCL